jgi:hypothetical protein
MAVFAVLGALGQTAANAAMSWEAQPSCSSWLESKWSPVTKLSDELYANSIRDRLLSIDAEIVTVDEHLAALRSSLPKAFDGDDV